jgi:hypothetical protein
MPSKHLLKLNSETGSKPSKRKLFFWGREIIYRARFPRSTPSQYFPFPPTVPPVPYFSLSLRRPVPLPVPHPPSLPVETGRPSPSPSLRPISSLSRSLSGAQIELSLSAQRLFRRYFSCTTESLSLSLFLLVVDLVIYIWFGT